jgi:hypothetical protein
MSSIFGDVSSKEAALNFDVLDDNHYEMILNSQGLGIGGAPTTTLDVSGNVYISNNLSIGNVSTTSNFHVHGTMGSSHQTVASNTILSSNSYVLVNTSSSNIQLTLPSANVCSGRVYIIKKMSHLNYLWVHGGGSLIDGTSPIEISPSTSCVYPSTSLYSNGIQWYTMNSSPSPTSVSSSNLVAYYAFEELTSGTVLDSSGAGHHGTHHNFSSSNIGVSGVTGLGLSYDGINDKITVPHHEDLNLNHSWTISLWSKFISQPYSWPTMVKKGGPTVSGAGYSFRLNFDGANSGEALMQREGIFNQSSSVVSVSGVWTHIAASYRPGLLTIYINGKATNTYSVTYATVTDATDMIIGYRHNFVIDELRIYNKELSSSEVHVLYGK